MCNHARTGGLRFRRAAGALPARCWRAAVCVVPETLIRGQGDVPRRATNLYELVAGYDRARVVDGTRDFARRQHARILGPVFSRLLFA